MDGSHVTRIKICGITNADDARAALAAGADAIGLVFAASPRRVGPEQARRIARSVPPLATVVGVFRDAPPDEIADVLARVPLDVLQLHGDEPPRQCAALPRRVVKRFRILKTDTPDTLRAQLAAYRVSAALLDPGAGDGQPFDWTLARELPGPVMLAGGLCAENVGDAIRTARPYAVDVCSGVEREPGRKDHDKMRAFVEAVRKADERLGS